MKDNNPTAAIVIIGNEILSGRTQDINSNYLAKGLEKQGVRLNEVRVIADNEDMIISTINELRVKYTYVFTTGGIGPTHDDITTLSIAKAFGVKVVTHLEALKLLENYYNDDSGLTPARAKMAEIPIGAKLIDNPISKAPGFIIENVYVMAGVPIIMQVMFDHIKHCLKKGKIIISKSIFVFVGESFIAEHFNNLQNKYEMIEMGSYPFIRSQQDNNKAIFGTNLILRSDDNISLSKAYAELIDMIINMGIKFIEESNI